MSNPGDRLRKEIKQLILLLRKTKERNSDLSFLSEQERFMMKNIDFVIQNFENMELQLPPEMTGDMAESFELMLREMIENLKEELGEEGIYLSSEQELDIDEEDLQKIDKSLPVPTIEQLIEHSDPEIPMKHRIMMAIQQVDEQLKNTTSDTEIADMLLDRRLELLERLRFYS